RQAGGLAVFVAIVIGDVGADEVVEDAVLGTALAEVDALTLDDDLGVHEPAAGGAQAARAAQVGVIAEVHGLSNNRPTLLKQGAPANKYPAMARLTTITMVVKADLPVDASVAAD